MRKPVRHVCTALLCAMLMGGSVAAHAAGIKEGLKIAFVPKQINNPYEVIADNGGMDAIKAFKGDGKVVGPSDAGASSQVSYINTLTTQHQDAIVIAANDANALVPYLKRAMDQGIKVVTFDSDTAPEGRQIFVNQANAESIGRGQIQLVSKLMGGEGEFAILSATPNATNQNTWIKWMQEELKKPEYSKMKLVKIAYGNDDDQKSFVETQGLLQAYPNLKAIVAPTSVGIAAAARYISSSPSKGKVAVTGLGTPNQMRAFVKNGTVKAFQLWDPGALGYLAAYAAANLASGTITGKEGESFDAGKLGKRTIGKGGEVILGPPTTFDASNIDNFNF
ncbi:rhamnose ABC transporter substrate-binding protein [Paraburkholderia heleia]|uniref:rhamnose ABC transporter substrate-binding protein n=1 Tax=Paraburkholderia heleia TaxID=634127 RepID=UPI0005A7ABB9|nr:rhamnose ABC transporter substrate-binding protein [Paraburkholderia heleia]